jgi:hypothetical protein
MTTVLKAMHPVLFIYGKLRALKIGKKREVGKEKGLKIE